jgi:hypothetical protein
MDVRNSSKGSEGYLKKGPKNIMIQTSGASMLCFWGMGKHYQKRIGASRYLKEISEKAKKSLK